MTNPIEQARQYLADKGKTSWSDADIMPMVEGLLEELSYYKPPPFKLSEHVTTYMIGSGPVMVAHGGSGGNGESTIRETNEEFNARMQSSANEYNARMADIREEGPSLLQRVKNWWRNR